MIVKMDYENWEDVSQIIFSSCDPNGHGDIPVKHLVAYIQREMQKVYDRTLLQELELMLLSPPGKQAFTIGKEAFSTIIKAWVSYVQESNTSLSDAHCDDSQFDDDLNPISNGSEILFASHLENSSFIQTSLEQQLTDIAMQRNNLLNENTRLGTLVKETEDALQTLTVDHNNLKDNFIMLNKKLLVYKAIKQDFEDLEITYKDQKCIIIQLESKLKHLQKEILQLEKNNSSLQNTVLNLKEERCKAIEDLEYSRNLLSKAKSDIFYMKQEFEDVVTQSNSEKVVFSERVRDLENCICGLRSTVEVYQKKNLCLEEELVKFKSIYLSNPGQRISTLTSFDCIGDSTNLLFCEEQCLNNIETPLSLYDELKASGDACFNQKELDRELLDFREKLKICSVELTDCQNRANFMTGVLTNVTKLLKWINNNTDEYDLIPEKITNIVDDQFCGSSQSLVLDFLFEIEQLSRMVSELMKIGSYTSKNNPEQLSKIDNTTQTFFSCCSSVSKYIQSDVQSWFQILPDHILKESTRMKLGHEHYYCLVPDQINEASYKENEVSSSSAAVMTLTSHTKALTTYANFSDSLTGISVPDTSFIEMTDERPSTFTLCCKFPVNILKNLFLCVLHFNYYLSHIVKLLMLLLICAILYGLIMHFIFECSRPYGYGFYNIEELLSPYIRLRHYAPPPV